MKFGNLVISRFIVAGLINTGLTYIVYILLLVFLPYTLAYSITYLIGIGLGYLLNAYWVFKIKPSTRSAVKYPVVYVLNYLFGVILLQVFIKLLGVSPLITPLLIIIITLPLMYTLVRFVFQERIRS